MSDNKGTELNNRIWTLFERAGFKTKPNSNDLTEEAINLGAGKSRTIDLLAIDQDLGVKIIGENKAQPNLDGTITTLIHDYDELKRITKADAVLLVLPEKDIPETDREYARAKDTVIWGEENIRYYEALVDAIGMYAKYEIIHDFGIDTSEEKTIFQTLAIHLKQPYSSNGSDLFLFTIPPDKLLKTCHVYRRAQGNAEAYQRMVIKSRLAAIRTFVSKDHALLPPSIIVHFGPKVTWVPIDIPAKDGRGDPITLTRARDFELVVLKIPLEYASIELIDGQHRLFGFAKSEAGTRMNFNLTVLGMAGLSQSGKRDTFVAINDKAQRVDANLVTLLKYTPDEFECQKKPELMAISVVMELNRTTPFKGRIKIFDTGNQQITLKGFSGYDLRGLLGPRGLLRKHYSNETRAYVGALRLYFSIIKSTFPEQWKDPNDYVIFSNRGISACLKLLRSILVTCESPLSQDIVTKYIVALRNNWSGSWRTSELSNSYVGSKGWKDFHRDLVSAIRKEFPEFKE